MVDVVECEVCGFEAPVSSMSDGWGGYTCRDRTDCRQPLTHPRPRVVDELDAETLDCLESDADEAEDRCTHAEVRPEVLRALIDAARSKTC